MRTAIVMSPTRPPSSASRLARAFGTLCRFLGTGLALGAVLALVVWGLGRVLTDRWHPTQYVYWVPAVLALGGVAALLVVSHIVGGVGTRVGRLGAGKRQGGRAGRLGWRLRLVAWLGLVVGAGVVLMVDWRMANAFRRAPAGGGGAGGGSLRVTCWNPCVWEIPAFDGLMLGTRPDLVLIANPPYNVGWAELGAKVGAQDRRGEAGPAGGGGVARSGRLVAISRHPMLRWGGGTLGIRGATLRNRERHWTGDGAMTDPGHALFVELDTRASLGRTTVVWFLDLPSDIRLSRWRTAGQARAAIAAWEGDQFRRTESGGQTRLEHPPGFPAPDLIIGDFNTPRGSASLTRIVGDFDNAFDQAGSGYLATWPRRRPLHHIDQAFVGPALRAVRYRAIDPGLGEHRMQVMEVVSRK